MVSKEELARFETEARSLIGRHGSEVDLLLSRFFDVLDDTQRLREESAQERRHCEEWAVEHQLLEEQRDEAWETLQLAIQRLEETERERDAVRAVTRCFVCGHEALSKERGEDCWKPDCSGRYVGLCQPRPQQASG